MKIRTDFITNSSSASFVIGKHYISAWQIQQILDYIKACEDTFWSITDDEDTVKGYTIMDNIDMDYFLASIGIPMQYVTYNRD